MKDTRYKIIFLLLISIIINSFSQLATWTGAANNSWIVHQNWSPMVGTQWRFFRVD